MMNSFPFGDPSGLSTQFWGFSLVGLFLGLCVFAGCYFPRLRNKWWRDSPPAPGLGLVLGSVLLALFVFIGFWMASQRFTGLAVEPGRLVFQYHWPDRKKAVPCEEVKLVDWLSANAKTGEYSLAVVLENGKTLKSQGVYRQEFDPLFKKIKKTACGGKK